MGFSRYKLGVLILIILLALSPITFLWVWQKHYMIVTLVSIAGLWLFAIFYLFYMQSRVIKELKYFLQTFEYKDSAIKFNNPKGDTIFKGLHKEFDRIIEAFQEIKLEKERELNFFKLAAEHAGVGLLAFSKTGEIKLINNAFTELFHVRKEKNINLFLGIDYSFAEFLTKSNPGKEVLKLIVNNQLRHIAAKIVSFRYEDEEFKLIAFQDIKNEIDQTELDAWQKLIRILRHEIHNSLSPITFLSSGLAQQIEDELAKTENTIPDAFINVQEGLRVIRKRSIGLSEFVENYKKLTDLPIPNIKPVSVKKFLEHIESLFKNECFDKNITLSINTALNDSTLLIDEKLIEQALINIIGNAIEAIDGIENGAVMINYSELEKAQVLSISDNGLGIPADLLDNIFIPFYTTKKNGSGIGLSLSRQIMRLHNGTLTVTSPPNGGTTFFIKF